MIAYAEGKLGDQNVDLKDVDRIIAIGSDRMMNGVKEARFDSRAIFKKRTHGHRLDQQPDAMHDERSLCPMPPTPRQPTHRRRILRVLVLQSGSAFRFR